MRYKNCLRVRFTTIELCWNIAIPLWVLLVVSFMARVEWLQQRPSRMFVIWPLYRKDFLILQFVALRPELMKGVKVSGTS